jgi:hypothetical protein
VGVVTLNNQEFDAHRGQPDEPVTINKLMVVKEFAAKFIRLGGTCTISSRIFCPYSLLMSELSAVKSQAHCGPSPDTESEPRIVHEPSLMRSFLIRSVDATSNEKREIRVGEELIESPYTFSVPEAFLRFTLADRLYEYEVSATRYSYGAIFNSSYSHI